jgi:TonB family protein
MSFLVDSTIKISLIVIAALMGATLAGRRQSAASRHWLLAVAVVCALLVPALGIVMPAWSITWRTEETLASRETPTLILLQHLPVTTSSARMEPTGLAVIQAVMVPVWILGVVVSIGVLCTGLLRLKHMASRAQRVERDDWAEICAQLSQADGRRRRVRLLQSDHATLLVTWGFIRPTIMLPAAAREWTRERARIVLGHELAHVRRGDWVAHMAGELLRALYWFNPVVWAACRRLRHESERACDDAVLNGGVDGSEYATHLLDLARTLNVNRRDWLIAPAMARRSGLEGRIRAMLNSNVNRSPLTTSTRFATIIVVAGLTIPLAGFGAETPASPSTGSVLRWSDIPLPETGAGDTSRSRYGAVVTNGAGSSALQLGAADFCCPEYLRSMLDTLRANWDEGPDVRGSAVLVFTIERSGRISDVSVESPSPVAAHNVNAQRAVLLSARQLPPLPDSFGDSSLTVHLRFEYGSAPSAERAPEPADSLGAQNSAFFTFSGTVLDATGRFVPEARVRLVNANSGATYEVSSNDTGRFEFVGLPSGEYARQVLFPGFSIAKETLTIAGRNVEQNVVLQVGGLEETITVRRASPQPPAPAEDLEELGRRVEEARQRALAACAVQGAAGGKILPPKMLHRATPEYSESLRNANIGGVVTIEAVIGTDGIVREARALTSVHPNLEGAALDAVRQWRFSVTMLNCVPVEVRMMVTVRFAPEI